VSALTVKEGGQFMTVLPFGSGYQQYVQ